MSHYIPVKADSWAEMVKATGLAAELLAENKRLKDEVAWLRKADRLVCWNPATAEWEVRLEVREANGAVKCCRADKPIP